MIGKMKGIAGHCAHISHISLPHWLTRRAVSVNCAGRLVQILNRLTVSKNLRVPQGVTGRAQPILQRLARKRHRLWHKSARLHENQQQWFSRPQDPRKLGKLKNGVKPT